MVDRNALDEMNIGADEMSIVIWDNELSLMMTKLQSLTFMQSLQLSPAAIGSYHLPCLTDEDWYIACALFRRFSAPLVVV